MYETNRKNIRRENTNDIQSSFVTLERLLDKIKDLEKKLVRRKFSFKTFILKDLKLFMKIFQQINQYQGKNDNIHEIKV